eukprot:Phypoly_transcript_14905.p1 GENE.Phypoly_transcript_14905~~Phypoly_transcript_14905.p1  ORF type:complete len:302 (+),score=27.49 Phypoly_transcript_14905:38-907(+)
MNDPDKYEFLASIVGELIARNQFPPPNIKNAVTQFYETKMVPQNHVLASISPRILYIENGLVVDPHAIHHQHLIGFSKQKIPPNLFSQLFPNPRPLPANHMSESMVNKWKTFDLDDITTFEDQKLAWGSYDMCGVAELRVMRVNRTEPLISYDIFPVLLESNLVYMQDIKEPSQMNAKAYGSLSPFAAFGVIFRTVANHRKDLDRVGSAYARVVAWKILASLVGVSITSGIANVEIEAKKCDFLLFQAPSPDLESWSIQTGLGVLRSDKKTVSCVILETGGYNLQDFTA